MDITNTTQPATLLSDNFSYAKSVLSSTAARAKISNVPDPETLARMVKTATCMERVRAALGNKSVHIDSWYRCLQLNRLLGSKDSSQHLVGEAVDFICPEFGTPLEICKLLISQQPLIRYDQLILEHEWVHISFAISSGKPRSQVLSLLDNGSYSNGLTNKNGTPY